jgi:hypothetical protein
MIVTYAHRYRRPPKKKPKQLPLPVRIVHAKPVKRRRQGIMISEPVVRSPAATTSKPASGTSIARPLTARQRRWHAMRAHMGLEP